MARRKKDKEELLAPDPFLEKANKAQDWVQKRIWWFVGALLLALAGVGALEYLDSQSARASSIVTGHLGEAVEAYLESTDPSKTVTSTDAAALERELVAARSKFRSVESDNPGASQVARLYEADLARRLGKHSEAAALYRAYVDKAPPTDMLRFLAQEGLGYALESQGKLDEALAEFDKLAGSQTFYKDYGLKHKARVLRALGRKDDAAVAYQAIVDMSPESKLKAWAEDQLKGLK